MAMFLTIRVVFLIKMLPGYIDQGMYRLKSRVYLKGEIVIIKFDWEFHLAWMKYVNGIPRESLLKVLDDIQSENESEIEVTVVIFPRHFEVKVDSGELLVCWNLEKSVYKVIKKEDAVHIQDKKTGLISMMSIQEFERKSKRRKK